MFRFMSPEVGKRRGSKFFSLASLTKLSPHLQNRGAALAPKRRIKLFYGFASQV